MGMKRMRELAAGIIVALSVLGGPAVAQQPSAASLAMARELVEIRGAAGMFDTLVSGVVEQGMGLFMQSNPSLSKDLQEVANLIRKELAPRRSELTTEVARIYAQRFTEAELKETVTFYKTPLGRKILLEEPGIVDQSFSMMQQWANKLSEHVLDRYRAEMKKKGHNL